MVERVTDEGYPWHRAPHPYVSTACFHELHEVCRQECKFCKMPCRCPCHSHNWKRKQHDGNH